MGVRTGVAKARANSLGENSDEATPLDIRSALLRPVGSHRVARIGPDIGPFPVGAGTRPGRAGSTRRAAARQTATRADRRAPGEAAPGAGRPGAAISAGRCTANADARASTNANTAGAGQGRQLGGARQSHFHA